MIALSEFLASEAGKFFSCVILFFGVTDIVIARVIFYKKQRDCERQIALGMSPEEKNKLEKQASACRNAQHAIFVAAAFFIALGIYGLIL